MSHQSTTIDFRQRILLPLSAIIASAILINPGPSLAQSKAAAPKFEVASIKPCKLEPGGGRGGAGGPANPERTTIACQTLERLIQTAYIQYANGEPPTFVSTRQASQPIDGSPAWVKSETFRIEAKSESPQTMAMMRGPMLQALLEDRFMLKVHRDTKRVPIYALVVARGGPKLIATKEGSCTSLSDFENGIPVPLKPNQPPACGLFGPNSKGGTRTFGQTLAGLSEQFSALLDRDVVDRTGIKGTFDIDLDAPFDELFARFNGPPAAGERPQPPLAAIESAVQKLGLRLESTTGPETVIVIDQVERPSEN